MLKLKLLACLLSLTIFCRAQQQTTNLIYNNSFESLNYSDNYMMLFDSSYVTTSMPCWVNGGGGYFLNYDSTWMSLRVDPNHFERAVRLQTGEYNIGNSGTLYSSMQTKLRTPLIAGETYAITGYINIFRDSFDVSYNYVDSGFNGFHSHIKQFGVLFTGSKVYSSFLTGYTGQTASVTYSIQPFSNRLSNNSWRRFEMLYTAQGGEQFMTIANFDSSRYNVMRYADIDSIMQHYPGVKNYDSVYISTYLYFDNLSLVPISDTAKTIVNPVMSTLQDIQLGRDRMLCNAAPNITLNAGNGFSTYQWSTGATTPTIQVSQTGTYMVTVSNGCQTYSDSITLVPDTNFVMPSYADAGVCNNTVVSYYVDTSIAYNNMLWSNGDTTYASSFGAGQHWLRLTNDCHLQYDTFEVNYFGADTVDLIQQQKYVLCSNASSSINAPNGYSNYLWSNAHQGQQLTPLQSGIYYLSATDAHSCVITDTINVVLIAEPQLTSAWPADTTLCLGKGFDVNLTLNTDSATYAWNTSDAYEYSLYRPIDAAGFYAFNVQNQCGSNTYSFSVATVDCDTVVIVPIDTSTPPAVDSSLVQLYIPNAFTPNGDGNNDLFKIYGKGTVLYYECAIYNRWGEVVYHSYDATAGWDGTYKSAELPTGNYVYVIKYNSTTDTQGRVLKGSVMLMR